MRPYSVLKSATLAGALLCSCIQIDGELVDSSASRIDTMNGMLAESVEGGLEKLMFNALTTNPLAVDPTNGSCPTSLPNDTQATTGLLASPLRSEVYDVSLGTANSYLVQQLTDEHARSVMGYIVRCALRKDQSVTYDHQAITWTGAVGLCPEWGEPDGSADQACQERVSGCLVAHVNAIGIPVPMSARGTRTGGEPLVVEPDELVDFPAREGAFFGNLFDVDFLDPNLCVRVYSGDVVYSYVGSMGFANLNLGGGALNRYALSEQFLLDSEYTGRVYNRAFSCWSDEWDPDAMYNRYRFCAGPDDMQRCASAPVGACRDASPQTAHLPAFTCAFGDAPPILNDGDYSGCKDELGAVWNFPLTVYLSDGSLLQSDAP